MKSITEFELTGKKVLVRVDFNVPLDDEGNVADNTRIRKTIPTIEYLMQQGAKIALMSHLGRPKGKVNPKFSLEPVGYELSRLLKGADVLFDKDPTGPLKRNLVEKLGNGQILLLENLRFSPDETANDQNFARQLLEGFDIYVNDAFGAAHRAHASVHAIAAMAPKKAVGLLMEKEIEFLTQLLEAPQKPFVAIIGGAKVSDKLPILKKLLKRVDYFIIGGAMAYTFLKSEGYEVGKSLVEDDLLKEARSFLDQCRQSKVPFLLPLDHRVVTDFDAFDVSVTSSAEIKANEIGVDIGPKTAEEAGRILLKAKTIFWNGPMGIYEKESSRIGTIEIAKSSSRSEAMTVVGGGDSVACIHAQGLEERFDHVSTGGGATLELLEGKTLPGLEAFSN